MRAHIIAVLGTVLLGATACASNAPQVAVVDPDAAQPRAVSVQSDSVLNSDNRPAVVRSGIDADRNDAAGLSRGQVTSVYEIQQ